MGPIDPRMLMMGVQRGPGSLGPVQPGAVQAQAQSAPPSTAASVLNGIASFMQNYTAGKRGQKNQATQEALQGLQLMQLGIPVDKEKIAKKLKMSGLGEILDFEGEDPTTQPGVPQQMPAGAQPAPDPAMQQMLMAKAAEAPTIASMQPPTPQPGFMSRAGQALGITPGQVNPASSGMAWLEDLARQGAENKNLSEEELALKREEMGHKRTEMEVRSGMLDILSKAIKGDPNALELASRLPAPYGLKDMPLDGMLKLGRMIGEPPEKTAKAIMYHALGGQQALQHMQDLAKDFAPYFNNDLAKAQQYVMETTNTGQSSLKPNMSLEQQIKVQDMADRLAAKYPTAPMNLLMTYGNLMATGREKPAGELLSYLSKNYKREGDISGEQFRITDDYHRKMMAQTMAIHADSINLARQKTIIDAAGDDGKIGWEMLKSPEEATRLAGAQMIASAANKKNELDMTFRGADGKTRTIPLGAGTLTANMVNHWFSKNQPGFNFEGAGAGLNQFIDSSKPAKKGFSLGDAMTEGRKQVERMILEMMSGNTEN